MKVPSRPGDERFKAIVESGRPDNLGRYRYVNYFPMTMPDGRAVVAEFSALTTVAPVAAATSLLLSRRIAMASDDLRSEFRIKLAFMLGRNPANRDDGT